MDFIQSLQKAIDYMEEHILEPITYEDVAKYIYVSSYHFHTTELKNVNPLNYWLRLKSLEMNQFQKKEILKFQTFGVNPVMMVHLMF